MSLLPSCISLYTGAGGLDYGFEAAGFQTRVAIESDKECCKTLRLNRDWDVIERSIQQVPSAEILQRACLKPGEVDVLIGGPPCQPFSKSGYWANGDTLRLADPRADTLREYMRCVADLAPRVFVLENVHGISYSGKEEGFTLLLRETEQINRRVGTRYVLQWKVLNAADYGVPQVRQRFFLIGVRDGHAFEFPEPTHHERLSTCGELEGIDSRGEHYTTAWDAIGHLSPDPTEDLTVRGRWADLLPSVPEGENYLWHTNRRGGLPLFGWRTRFWPFLLKLAKARPSWTIQAQPGPAVGPFHWTNRRLSIEETACIQTFPQGIRFAGARGSIQRQLGNAVPSLLAEIVARQVLGLLRRPVPSEPLLRLPKRRPIPPPDPPTPVPARFLALKGDHPDHPGTSWKARDARGSNQPSIRKEQTSKGSKVLAKP